MPLFKKFISYIFVLILLILMVYLSIYAKTKNDNLDYHIIKDYSLVFSYGFKDLYHNFLLSFIDMLSDMIIYIFTFKYKDVSSNVTYYAIMIGMSSLPFLVTLFQFLTFRGFQAFKLKIKKAKANPYYYHDYVVQNKDFGNDNIEDMDLSLIPILIPLRLLVLIVLLILMPIILLVYSFFEFIGLIRGITKTGRALDFE